MLAAIASCIFVIYLYRSLNTTAEDASPQTPEKPRQHELAQRLSALEARLRVLTDDQSGGASS